MKKLKVGIIFFIAIISCALLGTNQVAAAYSHGSRVTTPKAMGRRSLCPARTRQYLHPADQPDHRGR